MLLPIILWSYTHQDIEGWPVQIETALFEEHKSDWKAVRAELDAQLYRISHVVADEPLAKLRKITIWVRWNDPSTTCMAYHPAAGWLSEHNTDPAMAKGVEIANAKNFISWTYEQPWMVLHELAHGYHDQFLSKGFDNEEVSAAWKRISDSKSYESVLHWNAATVKHYALTNPMEFFAESTESYFGVNDFYPFVRAELKSFDPESYELMRRIWGDPQKR